MQSFPDVFLSYQQEFLEALLAERVTVVEKSRRTGFSWTAAAGGTLVGAAQKAAGGSDVFYIGYNLEMAREFIGYTADWARAIEPAAADVHDDVFHDPEHPDKDIKAFRVTFASGFKVLALPSVPRALRGMQGLVIIDEAAFHDDLPALLKAAFALLIWGGRVVIISTHNGEQNPFNLLVQDVRAGRLPYKLLRLDFDEALAQGLYERICFTTGKPWSAEAEAAWRAEIVAFYGSAAEEELFVVPNPSSGAFIPGVLLEARAQEGIPVLRYECRSGFELLAEHLRQAEVDAWIREHLDPLLAKLDADTPHCFGFDIARRGDLTDIWPLAILQNMVRQTPFVVELRNVPFAQQKQILWHIVARLPRRRGGAMDATGLGMQLAEETMQQFGTSIIAVMLTEPWYREHMPRFKAAFEDALATLPRDRDIIDDHRLLQLVRGVARVPERRLNDAGQARHGDAAIAHCLAHFAAAADPEFYEYFGGAVRGTGPGDDVPTSTGWTSRPPSAWRGDNAQPSRGILPELRGTW